jgi:hypothetical protein
MLRRLRLQTPGINSNLHNLNLIWNSDPGIPPVGFGQMISPQILSQVQLQQQLFQNGVLENIPNNVLLNPHNFLWGPGMENLQTPAIVNPQQPMLEMSQQNFGLGYRNRILSSLNQFLLGVFNPDSMSRTGLVYLGTDLVFKGVIEQLFLGQTPSHDGSDPLALGEQR